MRNDDTDRYAAEHRAEFFAEMVSTLDLPILRGVTLHGPYLLR